MTTHVFIVDSNTFKVHLEYMFAGTGAKEYFIDFNNSENTRLSPQRENLLLAMIADSQRIRKGDFILFYVQQNLKEKIYEGKFYGIFKVKEDLSFLDNNDSEQFLKNELNKSLTFRTLIEPFEVYPEGLTEWEALDQIKDINSPNQMIWSLIYRKLRANRGNTMINLFEQERLFSLLRKKNLLSTLEGTQFTFNKEIQKIELSNNSKEYVGRKVKIKILKRLIKKYTLNKAFESHLQAYILQNLGQGNNASLDQCLLSGRNICWLGNEISCGVGMQRIDIMFSTTEKQKNNLFPVELKAETASKENVSQIQRYIDWLIQYYTPNISSKIFPILVSKKINNKNSETYKQILESFKKFNEANKTYCSTLKYVEYEVIKDELIFKEIFYSKN